MKMEMFRVRLSAFERGHTLKKLWERGSVCRDKGTVRILAELYNRLQSAPVRKKPLCRDARYYDWYYPTQYHRTLYTQLLESRNQDKQAGLPGWELTVDIIEKVCQKSRMVQIEDPFSCGSGGQRSAGMSPGALQR